MKIRISTLVFAIALLCSSYSLKGQAIDTIKIQKNTKQTVTIDSSMFYDSGGRLGMYANSERDTLVIKPKTPGNLIQVVFSSFNSESYYDYIKIYNGSSVNAPLIKNYSGTSLAPTTYTAENVDGSLTIVFISDVSVVDDGWSAKIKSFQPVNVTSINITSAALITNNLDSIKLTATVLPVNAFNSKVNWSIVSGQDKGIIRPWGTLVAQINGTLVVRATAADGSGIYAEKTITVSGQTDSVYNMRNGAFSVNTGIFHNSLWPQYYSYRKEKSVLSMSPATADRKVRINFSNIYFSSYDSLTVYDGSDTLAPVIMVLNNSNEGNAIIVTATNPAGELTFKYVNTSSYDVYDNWIGAISLVRDVPVQGITVSGGNLSYDNQRLYYDAIVTPSDIVHSNVAWSIISGSENVIMRTVGNEARVTALKNGTMVLRASATDASGIYFDKTITISGQTFRKIIMSNISDTASIGYFYDSGGDNEPYSENEDYTITLTSPVPGKMVSLNFDDLNIYDDSLFIYNGTTTASPLITVISNSYLTNEFGADNPDGALTIHFKSGSYSNYSGWAAKIRLVRPVFADSIVINGAEQINSYSELYDADIYPTDAFTSEVTWSLDDPTMGYIYTNYDKSIQLVPRKNGTVRLRATCTDGSGFFAEKTIVISGMTFVPVTSITLSSSGTTITSNNGLLTIYATVNPNNATFEDIVWSLSDSTLAKLNYSSYYYCQLQAIGNGTVTVRATAIDGSGVYQEYQVTNSGQVTDQITAISLYGNNTINNYNQLYKYASISPYNADRQDLHWTLSNDTIASFVEINSDDCTLMGLRDGKVAIRAAAQDGTGIYDEDTITVIGNTFVPITSIDVSASGNISHLNKNATIQMATFIHPVSTKIKSVVWTVDNSSLASISEDGILTSSNSAGKVIVRATSRDGSGVYGEKEMTILNGIKVTSIQVSAENGGIAVGLNQTIQMLAAILPVDADIQNVNWSVNNSLATISPEGILTAGSTVGEVTVRATAKDGSGIFGETTINISTPVFITNISVSNIRGASVMEANDTLQMLVDILPDNATNTSVVWTVNNGLATISPTGLLIAGDTIGEIVIRATAKDGTDIFGEQTITITRDILVTFINVTSESGLTTINTKSTLLMYADLTPGNATNTGYTWSVNNSSLATIEQTGLLTTKEVRGNVMVRATANDGSGTFGTMIIKIMWPLSVKDADTDILTAYPNPVNDILFINSVDGINHMEVVGADGGIKMYIFSDKTQEGIDVQQLEPGFYILRIFKGEKIMQICFIKD